MSQRRAALLSALLLAVFAAAVLLASPRALPEGVRVRAGRADSATILAGRNDPEETALELLPGERVDINRATAGELQKLPGIGEALAQAILDYRQANGPFESLEQLMEVPGIGPARYAAVAETITIGDG